ncbi:LysR family transcriptional regulator [Rhodococcus sp. ACT016]|uniref:LysR family transcriptional regulator n=1 Tax=Rhodococcus sp. ACT016 TaxID=3134808 RepID=UPI003D27DD33
MTAITFLWFDGTVSRSDVSQAAVAGPRTVHGSDLSLRGLQALLAVVDEGHFGRAADKLYITTPALSQQIRRLETQLGVRLLERNAHPIELTEAGRVLVPRAREILATANQAVSLLVALERRESRLLRIGFINGAAGRLGRAVLDALHSPFELVQLDWSEQQTAVESGKVDAAFVRPPLPATEGLALELIGEEPRVAVLARGHRLAERTTIAIDELDTEVHVQSEALGEDWLHWWSVDPRPSGKSVIYGPSVRTMDELLEVVANGAVVAITAATISEYYTRNDIVFVPISGIEPCAVELCTRIDDPHPGIHELRHVIRSQLRQ